MKRLAWFLAPLLWLPGIAGGAAPSPEAQNLAQKSFAQAEAAFARREYTAAAAAFEQAGRAVPHPSSYLNAAEAWELAGEWVRAAEDCEIAWALPQATTVLRAEAGKRLVRLAKKIGRVELVGSTRFNARVDGGSVTSVPGLRWVPPGKHMLSVRHIDSGFSYERPFEVAAGAIARIEIEDSVLPAETLARTSTSAAGADPTDPLGLVTEPTAKSGPGAGVRVAFGVAGGATVGTIVLGALTLSAQSDFSAAPSQDGADAFYDRRLATNVVLGVAVVAAGVGALLWYLEGS